MTDVIVNKNVRNVKHEKIGLMIFKNSCVSYVSK